MGKNHSAPACSVSFSDTAQLRQRSLIHPRTPFLYVALISLLLVVTSGAHGQASVSGTLFGVQCNFISAATSNCVMGSIDPTTGNLTSTLYTFHANDGANVVSA